MSSDEVKQCPLVESYRFRTQCCVETCKFHSPVTRNRCLGMDIRFSAEDKPFSDAELLRYKFSGQELSVKDVSRVRKKSVDQVKALIMLHHVIQVLRERYSPDAGLDYVEGKSKIVDDVLNSEPLSLERLDFEPWMLSLLFDEKVVEPIAGSKFKLKDALRVKTKDFSALTKAVKILGSGNTLFDSVL